MAFTHAGRTARQQESAGPRTPAVEPRELRGDSTAIQRVGDDSALASARGGTILLRSIVDLSAAAQVRLARLLRDGEVRLGSGGPMRFDARIVAAAEPSIESEIRAGRLRQDLHRRLAA